jgi:cytochrome P450
LRGADWRIAGTEGGADALRRTPMLRACYDETMRLHPPVCRLPARKAVYDVVLPDGTAVGHFLDPRFLSYLASHDLQ